MMSEEMVCRKRRLSSFQIIILGFAGVILLGALLLMLPLSTTAGCVTPFHEALFTATSAVCVTGLVVQDTGSYWSVFGQAVILTLIQIGGLGVVTVAASFALLSGRRISLMQRSTMQDAISAPKVGGIVRLTRFILRGTFLIELIGALAMLPVFCRDYGWRGIWMAVFHSISAFCNAGFDILGTNNNLYPSLTGYVQNPVINITIMLLIITGGIGFLTWDDICENKLHFHRYRMQSKVILVTTLTLIVLPVAVFLLCGPFDAFPSETDSGSPVPIGHAENGGLQHRRSTRHVRRIAGRDDPSDAHRRFSRLHGRRHENHHAGSSAFQCCRDLPPAGQRSILWAQSRLQCRQTAATILTMYLGAVLWGSRLYQRIRESSAVLLLYEPRRRWAPWTDSGYYAAAAYSLANGIDRADVSGQSRRAYTHLCGGVQQKSGNAKLPQERITIG